MAKSIHIIPNKELPKSMDYDALRKEGIELNQELSGELWTDYNAHDPGITILEQFAFVLTDVAYRTNLPIETLLFHGGDHPKVLRSNALLPAEEIFPTSAVTTSDYRILLLDNFPQYLSNCWVEHIDDHREGIKGLYHLTLLLKGSIPQDEYPQIQREIRAFFNANRNLCEDLETIDILQPEQVSFTCEIDIFQDETVEDILSEVLYRTEQYFNPSVKFSQLEELQEKGMGLEEIFDLPSYKHGFILKEQLKDKQPEYNVSKMNDIILDIPGIRQMRNLQVFQNGVPVSGDSLSVASDKFFSLGFLRNDSERNPFAGFDIQVNKGGIINKYSQDAVLYSLEMKWGRKERSYEIKTRSFKLKETQVKTKELLSYESIQMSFPEIYGIGNYSPTKDEGLERTAKSWQLKAYLTLFDQLMVNHIGQLANIAELFDVEGFDHTNFKTYYSQLLDKSVPGVEGLLKKKLAPLDELQAQLAQLKKNRELDTEELQLKNELEDDVKRKEDAVRPLVDEWMKKYGSMSKKDISKSKEILDRKIVRLFGQMSTLDEGAERKKLEEEIRPLVLAELMQTTQYVEFEEKDMHRMMSRFDLPVDRKNRLLSHMLARFGERFTTDFHLKFSSILEGESEEYIERHLLHLKSLFLKDIERVNRFRSQGLNYLWNDLKAIPDVPLKRKVSLLLNINHRSEERLSPPKRLKQVKVERLTGEGIETSEDGKGIRNELKEGATERPTFIVNSASYYRFLFKYGLRESNYRIEKEGRSFGVYFHSPNTKNYSKVLSAKSRKDAKDKLKAVINFLKEANEKNEGFHLVEHVVLRPMDSDECFFDIKGPGDVNLFRSVKAEKEEIQSFEAHNALVLASYPSNYKVLRNSDEQYVVAIKSPIGKEIAKSISIFEEETKANDFIEQCLKFFRASSDKLDELFHLDSHVTFHSELLDVTGQVFFKTVSDEEIDVQEQRMSGLRQILVKPESFNITAGRRKSEFRVEILDEDSKPLMVSRKSFDKRELAEELIEESLTYFRSNLEEGNLKNILRYQRLNSRSAEEYNYLLSVVYPDWTARFDNPEFLQILKQTLYYCAPAHLSVRMVGLDFTEMKEFEDRYFEYLKLISNPSLENRDKTSDLSNSILDILMEKSV